jgi:hypothetical protein
MKPPVCRPRLPSSNNLLDAIAQPDKIAFISASKHHNRRFGIKLGDQTTELKGKLPRWTPVIALAWIGVLLSFLPCAGAFEISLKHNFGTNWRLEFPGQTNFYHQIQWAPTLAGPWSVVSIQVGTNGTQAWTNSVPATNTSVFFRVLRVATSNPLDADHDGMDDLYELRWSFLNPIDPSDASQDQDGDGLTNLGEYLYGTNPTDPDTDKDWVSDGYEVLMGTNPTNSTSAPPLEFRINSNALYTSNTTVNLDFGPFIAEQVALSESATMANAAIRSFSRTFHILL